jgi:DNA-binding beta-propeller fold protein YncE
MPSDGGANVFQMRRFHLRFIISAIKKPMRFSRIILATVFALLPLHAFAQTETGPYKVVNTVKVGGAGRWDYVYADAEGRKLYIPRTGSGGAAGRVTVYDLDSLKSVGEIPNTNGVHGVAIDPTSGHGFVSSKPIVMFDTKTLGTIKTIDVDGNPDGILFEPATDHVFVLSHRAPNVTVINAADGAIVGTIDLGGAPEEAASDGAGRVFIAIEDKDNVAVVDAKSLKVLAHYELEGKGGGPAGLAMDAKNHVVFAFCHDPHTAVILNADDGKIITTLPIGNGVDAAEFNPNTMEAFSSQGDGTLTVIKENTPTSFEVEQNVQTKPGARTSTLDSKTNQIFLITAQQAPPSTQPAPATQQAQGGARRGGGRGRPQFLPDSFTIVVVGK